MNLRDAIASQRVEDKRDPLNNENWWEGFRARDKKTNRQDRQLVNRGEQDNRLDKMQSIVDEIMPTQADEADPEYDPEAEDAQYETDFPDFDPSTGMYKSNKDFQFPEEAKDIMQMMRGDPDHINNPNGMNVNDEGIMQILEALGMGAGDSGVEYGDNMLGAMRGRNLTYEDIMKVIGGGGMKGGAPDPQALIEQAMAAKVQGMMDQDGGLPPSGKYQGKLGDNGERRKVGKGEQRVVRKGTKKYPQADKGDRE